MSLSSYQQALYQRSIKNYHNISDQDSTRRHLGYKEFSFSHLTLGQHIGKCINRPSTKHCANYLYLQYQLLGGETPKYVAALHMNSWWSVYCFQLKVSLAWLQL